MDCPGEALFRLAAVALSPPEYLTRLPWAMLRRNRSDNEPSPGGHYENLATDEITNRGWIFGGLARGTYAAGSRSGSTANCRTALPPIMRAISGSGTLASRNCASASQALVASWCG
jgi:hypothetical protein